MRTTNTTSRFFLLGVIVFCAIGKIYAQALPELMYYRFNTPGPVVQNESPPATLAGTASPTITGTSLTVGGTGLTGTALVGTGGTTTDLIATGWNTNLVSTDWTVSFWMNNFPSSTTLWYLFGDAGNTFRCFVNGAPGAGNLRLTGTGLPTIDVTAVTGGVNVLHFVRTTAPNEIKAYKNGVLFSTTAITGTMTVGTGLRIGSYISGSAISGAFDEFRLYNRALSATEISQTWNQTLGSKGNNDASISELVSAPKFCGASQNLAVKLSNKGKNILNNVNVEWTIDGIPQPTIVFTTPLDTLGHPSNISDTVLNLGAISYAPNQTRSINVWTSFPNSVVDTITNNDTLRLTLRSGLNGSYTINPIGGDYSSVAAAVSDLSKFGTCGTTTFNVAAGTTYSSAPLELRGFFDTIIFQKDGTGANPILTGIAGIGTTDAVISITGSRNITFDGIDVSDNTTTVAASRMEYGYKITNASATSGSSNNTVKNCKIILQRVNTASIGILQTATATGGGIAATALSGANHNNRYENVKIENSYNGILLSGTAAFPDSNNVITSTGTDSTIIGAATPNDIGNGTTIVYGIQALEQRNVEISKSTVRNLTHTSTLLPAGIWVNNIATTSNQGTARVYNNTIFNLSRTSVTATGGISGIRVDVSPNATAIVYNNLIYGMTSGNPTAASATVLVRGIAQGAGTGTGNATYLHNSISINNPSVNATSATFWKAGTGVATLQNNIFSNTSPAQTGVAKHYGVQTTAGSIVSSNNLYWTPNANGFVGFAASDRTNLSLFAAATSPAAPADGNEQGSANADPNFASTSNLDFVGTTPAVSSGVPVNTPIAITTDIAGNLRSASAPTIGAFETTQPLFDSSAPVIRNVIAVNGTSPSVFATISDNSGTSSIGNIQLWYRTGTSGSFTSISPDSVPVGSMNGTYKWGASLAALPPGSYQYYIAARDIVGLGLNVSVNPIQSTAFTSFASNDPVNYIANPDPSVNTRTFVKLSTLNGGTYSVGPTGTYAKLTNVAAALNTSEITGNVVFELEPAYDGTVGETFPITFNQFSTVGGNWMVTIRPATGASALQIRGSNTTTLIDLNGVKRIRFDGRPGGMGSARELTIANTAIGPVFRFINDAQNDTLQFINMADSNTSATSGIVFFSTTNAGNLATNGNSNNLIDNCSINGLSKTTNCIYSLGTNAPADNKNNTITNCNIFDFFSNTVAAVNGILLEGGNSNWNIGTVGNGNNFYQTSIRNSTSVPALTIAVGFRAIHINSATVNGCNIIGNQIGGNLPGIPGSTFVIGDNVGATNYLLHFIRAIDIAAAGTTTPTSIQGNTVSDITLYTGLNNTTAGAFSGINVLGGAVNTGNTIGNTIGAPTGTGSINLFYKNTTASINSYAIRYSSVSAGTIQNNIIGSISADAASGSIQLLCVYLSGTLGGSISVTNNTIGSLTTSHSIQSLNSSLAAVNVMGIVTSAATGAAVNITNNTVINLSSLCTNNTTANGLKGIYITGATANGATISGNTISKLYSESNNTATDQASAIIGITSITSGAGGIAITGNTISALVSGTGSNAINIMGIYYASASTATVNRIDRNLIHSLYASASNASAATISGITQGAGSARILIANNMIRIGLDSSGGNATAPHFLAGIHKIAGGINTTIFNTVNIGGTSVANGVSNTYAYRSIGVGTDSLLNNIFINTRTNSTTGGTHYAVGLGSTTTLTINRNLYNATGVLGQFNNIDQATLVDWQSATTQDLQSVNTTVNFVSNTDLHLTGASIGNTALTGVTIIGITTDFDGQLRDMNTPYMGADEIPGSPLPVRLVEFTARKKQKDVVLNWLTATEVNASRFEVERSVDGRIFGKVGSVSATGNSTTLNRYQYQDIAMLERNSTLYYRLKMVDANGRFEYSKTVRVLNENRTNELTLSVFPNPFTNTLSIAFEAEASGESQAEVFDLAGKAILSLQKPLSEGHNIITIDELSNLQSGMYFISISNGNSKHTIKISKQ